LLEPDLKEETAKKKEVRAISLLEQKYGTSEKVLGTGGQGNARGESQGNVLRPKEVQEKGRFLYG